MKVVLLGSLGHISKPLAEGLIGKGHSVVIISSKPDRIKEIEALGATASIGLVEDIPYLVSAFKGADAVYCMVPPNFFQPDQVEYYERLANKYARAITESGVKRVIHLSSYGADLESGTGFIVGSNRSETIFNELSEVSITHMRPGYFYYNLLSQVEMIKNQGIMGSNYGGITKLLMVSPADIATSILEELETPASHRKVKYVASDDRPCIEIAKVIGEAIGKPDLKWITFTDEQLQTALIGHGVPESTAGKLVELGTAIRSGALRGDYERRQPHAMGKVKLEDYAKDFAKAFNPVQTLSS